ncbi:MAG: hypothetical protein LBH06_07325 [Rikenellaceae bacterium]|jgi:hypothetical protein|nr:hypothetical protein [Rikenellaceae bacterium]
MRWKSQGNVREEQYLRTESVREAHGKSPKSTKYGYGQPALQGYTAKHNIFAEKNVLARICSYT